jgi:hypothetical protein
MLNCLFRLGWTSVIVDLHGMDQDLCARMPGYRDELNTDLQRIREAVLALSRTYDQSNHHLDFQKVLSTLDRVQRSMDYVVEICSPYRRGGYYKNRPRRRAAINKFKDSVLDLKREIQSTIRGLAEYIPTTMPISVSRQTVKQITYEQVCANPQSAVQYAFTLFEECLRARIGAGPELYGEKLINGAFGGNGCLTYGELPAEQLGVRNLMSGAYAVLRGPRIHRIIKDDVHRALAIIALVDLLMQVVDEAEDR